MFFVIHIHESGTQSGECITFIIRLKNKLFQGTPELSTFYETLQVAIVSLCRYVIPV